MTFLGITAELPPRSPPPPAPPSLPPGLVLQGIERSVRARMLHLLQVERGGPDAIRLELAICAKDDLYWLSNYAWTYDPRNPLENPPLPAFLPFDLVPRQIALWQWFAYIMQVQQDGCVKKSRGIGFTWLVAALAWHRWRFRPGWKTTFGSRNAVEVDQIGNPDSFFERVRMIGERVPKWMLPPGFRPVLHDKQRLMVNPENENTIRGDVGDEMGRGGRSSLYIIDEAAVIEHADRVDAATSANSNVRIWGSTINPHNENNLFQRKYTSFPPDRVFRFHYTEHPIWTAERIRKKKQDVSEEIWAAEFEIDDSFTVEDIVIPRSWVDAAKRIKSLISSLQAAGNERAQDLRLEPKVEGTAGGDIGGGKAHSVVVARFGPVVVKPQAWLKPDTIDTALKMLDYCEQLRLPKRGDLWEPKVRSLRYDAVAIGQGVESVMKRNQRVGLVVTGINTGNAPSETKWPDGQKASEKFFNLKAELWWEARERFKKTYEMVQWLEDKRDGDGEPLGQKHPVDELISLPDDPTDTQLQRMVDQMSQVKWTRRENGKIQIESKQSLAKRGLPSPDHADALVLTFGRTKADKWVEFSRVNV